MATDVLTTVLELKQDVAGPAERAAEAVEDLGNEAKVAERKVDDLGDEMFRLSGISDNFSRSLRNTAGSPFQGMIDKAGDLGGSLGNYLAPAVSQVSTFLAGPGGMLAGLLAVQGVIYGTAAGVGFLGEAVTMLGAALGTAMPLLTQMGGVAIAMPFMDKAKEFDANTRLFGAALGDPAKGEQMAKFMQGYGMKSAFEQGPLQQLGLAILNSGRRFSDYAPAWEALAMMKGGKSEDLENARDVFMKLAGGQIAEALGPEGLGRFGIDRNRLSAIGATFNKQGQLLNGEGKAANAEEALQLINKLYREDPILKEGVKAMEGSITTKLSNIKDAFDAAATEFGKSMSKAVLPVVGEIGDGMRRVVNSGAINDFADRLAEIFGLNGKLAGSFDNIAASFLAGIEVALGAAKNAVNWIIDQMKNVDKYLDGIQTFLDAATVMESPFRPMFAAMSAGLRHGRGAFNFLEGRVEGVLTGGEENAFGKAYERYLNKIKSSKTEDTPDASSNINKEKPKEQPDLLSAQATDHLAAIRENTKQMADAVVRRIVMGGGELGKYGVTAYDVSRMKGRPGGTPIRQALNMLEDSIWETLGQHMGRLASEG